MLEDTEFAIASSAEKQQQIIDSMLSKVVGSYQSAFDKINQIIGNTGWVGSNEFNQNQSQLGTQSGAQSQKDNATQSQSNVGSSSTASPEIIISKDGGVLTHLERGDKVFNHEMSENLWNLAKEGDSLLMNDKMLGLNMNGGTKIINNNRAGDVINNHFDSLLTVNGNVDKEALPKLKDILQQSYEYTSKRLFSETKRRW